MALRACAWDDCGDIADYLLRFAEQDRRLDEPLAVCAVHLADGIVSMIERLRLAGLEDGVSVQVSLAE